MRILAILFFAAFIVGCSNGNKNSNSEIENNESNVIDEQVQEQELPKESKWFNDLLSLTQKTGRNFEGTAFVGNLNGPCNMILTSNSQGDNIAQLRYQINNYYQGKADKVDETYTITELKLKSAKNDGLSHRNAFKHCEDTYLYGNVNGLKSSINDGAITDGSGSGNIYFILDSVNYELKYSITSSANWSHQGRVLLGVGDYIKFKELLNKSVNDFMALFLGKVYGMGEEENMVYVSFIMKNEGEFNKCVDLQVGSVGSYWADGPSFTADVNVEEKELTTRNLSNDCTIDTYNTYKIKIINDNTISLTVINKDHGFFEGNGPFTLTNKTEQHKKEILEALQY